MPAPPPEAKQPASFLLTIFLLLDKTKTLDGINAHWRQAG